MSKTYAFIINYNRLTLPRKMADYLAGCDGNIIPVIIDNNSDYEPLLEYYKTCPHKVERFDRNMGNCVVWITDILDRYNLEGNFIVTDSDLQIDHISNDFLEFLQEGLKKYEWACKSGFGLEIKDLPNTKVANEAKGWERQNWYHRLDSNFFNAPIDTTFCLCRTRLHDFKAIRTDYPYVAKHMPWYWTKENIPDDEKYYFNSIGKDFNHYGKIIKKEIQ